MDHSEIKILPIQSDSSLKKYFCPHCDKFLFKGNIKKLNMACHHCQKLIRADENEFAIPEAE